MKRETVYRTQTNIDGLRFKGESKETYIILKGTVARVTQRKLFGFIPLPDKWVWEISMFDIRSKTVSEKECKNIFSFDTFKRLSEERLDMERMLRNKCKDYKKIYSQNIIL